MLCTVNIWVIVKHSQLFCFVCEFIKIPREFPEQTCPPQTSSNRKVVKSWCLNYVYAICVCLIVQSFAYWAVFIFPGVKPAGVITKLRERSVDNIPQSGFVLRHQITVVFKFCFRQETLEESSSFPCRIGFHTSIIHFQKLSHWGKLTFIGFSQALKQMSKSLL